MSSPFRHAGFRTFYAAQILSLVGIGLMTVSLSLSAFSFGGVAAGGWIFGGLLAIKMVAYVLIAPVAETLLAPLPRRATLVGIDLIRLAMVGAMGLAGAPWQIALLVFLFFAASSGFTPLFQATLPEMLPEEETYTRALGLSRLAYTLEAILSPAIAALALTLVPANALFFLAALAFLGSMLALAVTALPAAAPAIKAPFLRRVSKGMTIYFRTPRLRGLFLLNLALSLAMAWVIVNTVVYAGKHLGAPERYYTLLMGCYGVGAAAAALIVPRLLDRATARGVMAGGAFLFAALGLLVLAPLPLPALMLLWAGFGAASSMVLTPGGLVLVRSAASADRPAIFAAQFSLSHAGWLLAYPLAGWLGSVTSPGAAMAVLSLACAAVALAGLRAWPADDPAERAHSHPDLPPEHPHLRAHPADGGRRRHVHAFVIDDLHRVWPGRAAAQDA
ncbi:MFS transporter [Rhodobacteraceae bacterium 2CG4]|uniref:MFS transporter n=1 Tax=Halovulum marinum TaxID=2662447 RepID=A0A6L5YYY7_9RHOB|nr:MFS transporter [Halovulum marinum]MSU89506.1 MFS transporter [Halovulum marinum]